MWRRSLRMRLAVAGAVTILLSLGLAAVGLVALFGAHVERRAVAELSVQLDQLIAGLERDSGGRLILDRPPADPRFLRPLGGLYWQIEGEGLLLRSRSLWDGELALPSGVPPGGVLRVWRLSGPAGETLLVAERRVTLPDRLGAAQVRAAVAMDAAELTAARTAFLRDLAPYLALLAAALIAAGWVQVAVGLRPLAAVGARVAAVRSGRSRRLGADFPSEVQPLAAELDALIEARERDVVRARARAGDLAHGFKTPLQALLGEADRLRRRGDEAAAASVESLVQTMQRVVDAELARTRATSARAGAERADVARVAGQVVSVVQRTPAGARLGWSLDLPPDLCAALDAGALAEALGALVENAARHAEAHVRVAAVRAEGRLRVIVGDDGPGIPADRVETLMERGAPADGGAGSTGLGLAIAREVAEAAGGALTLQAGAPGLVATLDLPAAEPADAAIIARAASPPAAAR